MENQNLIHYLPIVRTLSCKKWARELEDNPQADTIASTDIDEVNCPDCKREYFKRIGT